MKRDLSECRSNGYQWTIVELPTAPDTLTDFSDLQGLSGRIMSDSTRERIDEIKDQLKIAYWRIISENLTPRQQQVIRLCAAGLTQVDVAKELGVNQSSITKSINGNCDYGNKKKKTVYGGSKKKLVRIAEKDLEVQRLLNELAELTDG